MRTRRRILIGAGLGAAAFIASHMVIVMNWSIWFHGVPEHRPYWMNSTSSLPILFTLANVMATAAMVARLWTHWSESLEGRLVNLLAAVASVAVGATVAMVMVVFIGREGPGPLGPIPIAMGGVVLCFGAFVGAAVAVVSSIKSLSK